jgi:hypothetical protein
MNDTDRRQLRRLQPVRQDQDPAPIVARARAGYASRWQNAVGRRVALAVATGAACLVALSAAAATGGQAGKPVAANPPIDGLRLEMALGCGSSDVRKPQYYYWTGTVHARRAGERDRLLFNVQGVNPRACQIFDDPARGGRGYRAVARELMLYLDPVTGEPLSTWRNPWTGETVDVIHMQNDPASMSEPKFPLDAAGQPVAARLQWRPMGQSLVAANVQSFFRDSPLGGAYQDFVGGKYQVMEISSFVVQMSDLRGYRDGGRVPYVATWTRISPWLPWMKMGGRDGQIVLTSQGTSTLDFAELPEPLRSSITSTYPSMREAPSFDDTRPFQTSWDSLRRELDRRRAAP